VLLHTLTRAATMRAAVPVAEIVRFWMGRRADHTLTRAATARVDDSCSRNREILDAETSGAPAPFALAGWLAAGLGFSCLSGVNMAGSCWSLAQKLRHRKKFWDRLQNSDSPADFRIPE